MYNKTSAHKQGARFLCNGLLEDRLCLLSHHDGSCPYCSHELATGLFSLHSPDLMTRMKLTASKLLGEVPAALHAYDGLGTSQRTLPRVKHLYSHFAMADSSISLDSSYFLLAYHMGYYFPSPTNQYKCYDADSSYCGNSVMEANIV
jgi:hypothetical protein